MNITDEIVDYVSKLSKVELTSEGKQQQKEDMQSVVNYIEILNMLDVKEVEAATPVSPIKNVFREDKVKQSSNRKDILSNAPSKKDGYYKVFNAMD